MTLNFVFIQIIYDFFKKKTVYLVQKFRYLNRKGKRESDIDSYTSIAFLLFMILFILFNEN